MLAVTDAHRQCDQLTQQPRCSVQQARVRSHASGYDRWRGSTTRWARPPASTSPASNRCATQSQPLTQRPALFTRPLDLVHRTLARCPLRAPPDALRQDGGVLQYPLRVSHPCVGSRRPARRRGRRELHLAVLGRSVAALRGESFALEKCLPSTAISMVGNENAPLSRHKPTRVASAASTHPTRRLTARCVTRGH